MFATLDDSRLYALGSVPDRDLLDLIQTWFPACQMQVYAGPMTSWLEDLFLNPPHGLILFSESLTQAELQTLSAWLSRRPKVPVLLLTGPRGLVGAEEIICHPALKVMPGPWSAPGLRLLVQKQAPQSSIAHSHSAETKNKQAATQPSPSLGRIRITAAEGTEIHSEDDAPGYTPEVFEGDFLDGLVERFRDPLASLSGYLQLLNGSADSPEQLVHPALAAAREIESALEVLQLASDTRAIRPTRLSGEHMAIEALKEAQKGGCQVQLNLEDDFLVRADGRLVRAALQCARVQLSRFGGSAQDELVLRCVHGPECASLIWELTETPQPHTAGSIPPPAFLTQLLERFAQLLGAEAIRINGSGEVPRQVGLAWPNSATLQPSY
jgi:hypothetical protein